MARVSRSGRSDTVLRGSGSANSDHPSSEGTSLPLRFVRKFRKGWKARRCPHSLPLVCCYVAIFFAGFQQYGVSTVFTSLILNSFEVAPVHGIPLSLVIFGIPYAILSLPLAYVMGQKVGYKWTVITGQVLVYLYSLYNMLDCSLSHCVYKWQTGVPTLAFSLLFFCVSLPVLSMNLWLLALEQIPHESSETRSVCIHWMWLVFFFGRLMGAFIGSAIFWWTSPVFLFVIQLGMASIAITIVIWAPLEKFMGPYTMPFKTIWQVTRETTKQLCNRRNRELQRRVDVPETYDPDYEPNAFERASHDFSGPLPRQDVRDVQNFYLTLFMLVSLVGIWIMYSLLTTAFVPQVSKLNIPRLLIDPSKSFSFWANVSGKVVHVNELSLPLTWTTNTISDLTAVLTILILDRLVYPIFIHKLKFRRRITIGVVFGFLACVAAVSTEATRDLNLKSFESINATATVLNKIPSVFLSASILFESAQVSMYWVVPQYLLYGVMVAFVMPGADELALVAAPAEMQAFLFGINHTLLGVSQITAALFILSQTVPHSYWCFFCYFPPRTGLFTFVSTAVAMFLLFPLYLALSHIYGKLELSIIKPRNPIILPRGVISN